MAELSEVMPEPGKRRQKHFHYEQSPQKAFKSSFTEAGSYQASPLDTSQVILPTSKKSNDLSSRTKEEGKDETCVIFVIAHLMTHGIRLSGSHEAHEPSQSFIQ